MVEWLPIYLTKNLGILHVTFRIMGTNNSIKKIPRVAIPESEKERLEALKGYNILDTLPEKQFDDITRLASIICEVPISLISLLDEGRQWFKSHHGLDVNETPREMSFCQYAILDDQIFEVEDSLSDQRFCDNPLVTSDPFIRFYAGAPLKSPEGFNIGTLCVIDRTPRKLTDNQREALEILANEVVINLELRRERIQIEQERRVAFESNALLNAFLDNSPSFISLRNTDGEYLIANKATLENIKRTKDEVIGFRLDEIFGEAIAKQVMADDREVIASGKGETKEYIVEQNGATEHYIRYVFPVFGLDGNAYGVGVISNRVTEAKKLEQEIKLTSERFTSLFYNSPVAMTITDMTTRNFVMANNAFLGTFGFTSNEVIGESVESFDFVVNPDDVATLEEELMKNSKIQNREIVVLKRNGEEFVALCSLEIINVDGQAQIMSAFQDITKQKRVESALQEAKKAAEANTMAKSSFLANMSHEIRTPLNAMLGFADLMNKTHLSGLQREYLDAIDASGKNLLNLINDILDFSKIEAGMLSIEKTPFSIQQALDSVNMMFFDRAQSKGLKFSTSVDPAIPSLVNGDPTRFTQIMINLIGNAIKFTNKGSVEITCKAFELSDGNVTMEIVVSDTGIGIAEEKLNSIFNRFTQAEDDTTRNFGGTGLGLSIAKKLVELQGGELWVKSSVNEGSVFSFKLTYEISESNEYAHKEALVFAGSQKDTFKGKRVLIVEDNLLNQKLASTLLIAEGFEVESAANGRLALEKLNQVPFDIVLMDIQMPVMDGYQATRELRNNLNLGVPVIAMTANALAGERERCIEAGMNEYITKPFKTQELLEMISVLMG